MNPDIKARLNELISHQAEWIKLLQENQGKLEKYRDEVLPINEQRIEAIAMAQRALAQAAKHIAEAIADAANQK